MSSDFKINDLQLKYLELETLLDITHELNSFDQIPVLLQEILIKSCGVLNASSGLILIEDDNSDVLHIGAHFNIDISVLKGLIFNKRKGIISKINESRKALNITIEDDSFLSKTQCKFGLIAPFLDKKNLVGVIILFDKESRKGLSAFLDSDANMLSAIASQASVAYNNIKLIENIKEAKTFNDNVMQSIVTGVFTTNLMGEINHINRAAIAIINLEKDLVLGNHFEYVFESNQFITQLINKCELESITISESQILLECNGRSTTVNISVSPLMNDLGQPIGSVVAMEDLSNLDKLKSTFKKYVSKQIVDQILENEDHLNLGGQELEVTTLFSDIRGFTSMSEKMSPKDVVDSLNEYFDKMIEVVFKHNGTLDKIIGDALMVIYGAPIGSNNDAERALLTAIEMQQKLEELNVVRLTRGQSPLEIGIGLNTGKAISGNIGSKVQMNYTVIGDAVNLSSRLCSFAKAGQIIVSESVFSALKNKSNFAFRELTPIHVKGKEDAVNVFEVSYFKNDSFSSIEEKYDQIEHFLISNLPGHLVYHSIDHIRDVVEKSELYGRLENLSEHKMHLLKTAAWLHDIGYIWDEKAHEARGCQFAKEFLPAWGFAFDEIDAICEMIMATRIPQTPTNLMQEILCDADLDYLGRDDYFMISDRLLMEIRRTNDLNSNDWKKLQLDFFNKHQYYTASANSNRFKGKQINAQKIANKN